MSALEDYVNDKFSVFGYLWSEVTDVDRRRFENVTLFPSYITRSDNEHYLRCYYDMLNFGGTPHQEHERALKADDEREEVSPPKPF